MSKLILTHDGEPQQHQVHHFHYTLWPDFGSPPSTVEFNALVKQFSLFFDDHPILAHCSAGLGRTGALVAVHTALECHKAGHKVDLPAIVRRMRRQRGGMVQTLEQYQFCYQAIADMLMSKRLQRVGSEPIMKSPQARSDRPFSEPTQQGHDTPRTRRHKMYLQHNLPPPPDAPPPLLVQQTESSSSSEPLLAPSPIPPPLPPTPKSPPPENNLLASPLISSPGASPTAPANMVAMTNLSPGNTATPFVLSLLAGSPSTATSVATPSQVDPPPASDKASGGAVALQSPPPPSSSPPPPISPLESSPVPSKLPLVLLTPPPIDDVDMDEDDRILYQSRHPEAKPYKREAVTKTIGLKETIGVVSSNRANVGTKKSLTSTRVGERKTLHQSTPPALLLDGSQISPQPPLPPLPTEQAPRPQENKALPSPPAPSQSQEQKHTGELPQPPSSTVEPGFSLPEDSDSFSLDYRPRPAQKKDSKPKPQQSQQASAPSGISRRTPLNLGGSQKPFSPLESNPSHKQHSHFGISQEPAAENSEKPPVQLVQSEAPQHSQLKSNALENPPSHDGNLTSQEPHPAVKPDGDKSKRGVGKLNIPELFVAASERQPPTSKKIVSVRIGGIAPLVQEASSSQQTSKQEPAALGTRQPESLVKPSITTQQDTARSAQDTTRTSQDTTRTSEDTTRTSQDTTRTFQDTSGALQPTSQEEPNTAVLDWVKRLESGKRTSPSIPKPSDPGANKKTSIASLINSKPIQPTPEFSKGTNPKPSEPVPDEVTKRTPVPSLTNPKPHIPVVQATSPADAAQSSSTISGEAQGTVAQLKRLFAS